MIDGDIALRRGLRFFNTFAPSVAALFEGLMAKMPEEVSQKPTTVLSHFEKSFERILVSVDQNPPPDTWASRIFSLAWRYLNAHIGSFRSDADTLASPAGLVARDLGRRLHLVETRRTKAAGRRLARQVWRDRATSFRFAAALDAKAWGFEQDARLVVEATRDTIEALYRAFLAFASTMEGRLPRHRATLGEIANGLRGSGAEVLINQRLIDFRNAASHGGVEYDVAGERVVLRNFGVMTLEELRAFSTQTAMTLFTIGVGIADGMLEPTFQALEARRWRLLTDEEVRRGAMA